MAPATTPAAFEVRKWRRDSLPSLDMPTSDVCITAGCVSGMLEVDVRLRMLLSSLGPHPSWERLATGAEKVTVCVDSQQRWTYYRGNRHR
jgi:hypothetical protein